MVLKTTIGLLCYKPRTSGAIVPRWVDLLNCKICKCGSHVDLKKGTVDCAYEDELRS
jgi:hypothetical protein